MSPQPSGPPEPQDFAGLRGIALVTGGSGGLGSAVAVLLARRGADVAITFRSNDERAAAVRMTCSWLLRGKLVIRPARGSDAKLARHWRLGKAASGQMILSQFRDEGQ